MKKSSLRREIEELIVEEPKRDRKGNIIKTADGEIEYEVIATLLIEEPLAEKQDEYVMLNTRIGIEAEKVKKGIKAVGEKVFEFGQNKHSKEEEEKFSTWLKAEMKKLSGETFTDNREVIEFIVGKLNDNIWKKLTSRHRQEIIDKFEKLCDMERVTKNVLELIPQEVIQKIYDTVNK